MDVNNIFLAIMPKKVQLIYIIFLVGILLLMWVLGMNRKVRTNLIHQEGLENCPTQPNPACDANMINNMKNQINVLELKVSNLQKQITTTEGQVQVNKGEIDKFNSYIKQLQVEVEKGSGK
jgi:peptidoglycan hydrolase CwlO-like protein